VSSGETITLYTYSEWVEDMMSRKERKKERKKGRKKEDIERTFILMNHVISNRRITESTNDE
jgi:homoaconitase/3-isopropylmalate dehydratase large subunit